MRRIAVVDDDMDIGNMLQEVLERAGYGVLRAYSGTEALLLLERQRPDLVLLDLMLPGLSGEAVLPHLAGVPVIVLSARGEVQDKVSLLLEGAADYMTKPFDTRELLARIAVQLRRGTRPPPAAPRRSGAGRERPHRPCRRPGGASDPDGVRHFEAPAGASPPGGHPLPAPGGSEPGHPGLRGELAEGPRQQPPPEATGGRGRGHDRGGVGDRVQAQGVI